MSRMTLLLVVLITCCPTLLAQPEGWEATLQKMEARHRAQVEALRKEYEGRIAALESAAESTQDQRLEQAVNGYIQDRRRGLEDFGQTTIFDSRFNPAFSLTNDFILAVSNQSDRFGETNQFGIRSTELGITGRVDPHLAYFAVLHFAEGEVEVEEAYGWVDDWLPDTLQLKFGRYSADFGKISPRHEHDLATVDKPQVHQEFLGGSLRGTGLELHHWLPLGEESLLRWSLGVVSSLDGDSHAVFGPAAGGHHHHEEEEGEDPGEREFRHLAWHARVTALFEVSAESNLQFGLSGAWAPREAMAADEDEGHPAFERERWILGLDLGYNWSNQTSGERLDLLVEALATERQLEDGERVSALGFTAQAEWNFDRFLAVGLSGGWFQHVEDDDLDSWDAGVFVTWNVDEFNRLRVEARLFDDPEENFWAITLQWTTILGSHGHGINW